jgi:hypothetical protein
MDVDYAAGYGSHDFGEPAQKRQRLDHDSIYPPAPDVSISPMGQLDSWYQSADENQQLDSEGLWTSEFHDSQNNASIWSPTALQFTSFQNEDCELRDPLIAVSTLLGLQMDHPSEYQQNYHHPVVEANVDREVAEDSVVLSEQEEDGLICFGMVGLQRVNSEWID